MRIVICDDHRLLLEAMSHALSRAGFTVEAATSDPDDAVRAVRLYAPDLLLLDLGFPSGDGLSAAREALADHPRTRVVIITGSEDPAPLLEAIRIGVSGYLRKDEHIDAIVASLRKIVAGERVLDMSLYRRLRAVDPHAQRARTPLDLLTDQERVVLRHLGDALTTTEIVREMGISQSTVRSHVQAILSKLGVHSRLQAVAHLHDATRVLAASDGG